MDWRGCGEAVRERGRRFLSGYARKHFSDTDRARYTDGRLIDRTETVILAMPVAWLAAGFVTDYDPSRFVERRLSRQELGVLCAGSDPKNGRPLGNVSRAAATIACYFYEAWRSENQKRGIKDYGHRLEMKDYAAQAVVEDIFALQFGIANLDWEFGSVKDAASFIYIVRDLMEKPKKRRDPGDDARLNFLASPAGLKLPPKPTENS